MTTDNNETNQPLMSRRRMLMRLGLTTAALYTAPVIFQLSEAKASDASRSSGPSFSRGGRRGSARSRHRSRRAGSFSGGHRRRHTAGRNRRRRANSFSG